MFRKGLPLPSSSNSKDKIVLVEKGTKVKYHPLFEVANLIPDLFEAVSGCYKHDGSYWEDRYVDVSGLLCNNEYATSPPSRRLYLNFGGGPLIENETGVTVDDAIGAAVETWDSEPDDETREEWEEGSRDRQHYYAREGIQSLVELELETGQNLTWRDILGERNGWQGSKSAEVLDSDTVLLDPQWFGS